MATKAKKSKTKIVLKRATVIAPGKIGLPGQTVEMSDGDARDLLRRGRAVVHSQGAAPASDTADDVESGDDPDRVALEKMSKAELAKHADDFGVDVPAGATKAQIVDAILEEYEAE